MRAGRTTLTAIALASFLPTSCSSGDDEAASTTAASTPATTAAAPATSESDTTPAPIDTTDTTGVADTADPTVPDTAPPTTAAPSTTTTSTTATTFPSAADELGLTRIEQTTEVAGGGARPVLEWEPVDGAARYHVFVLSPSATPYWGWETTETSVPVGGLPQLGPGAPGPAVTQGMTWSVSATDDAGHIIALSAHRPISP